KVRTCSSSRRSMPGIDSSEAVPSETALPLLVIGPAPASALFPNSYVACFPFGTEMLAMFAEFIVSTSFKGAPSNRMIGPGLLFFKLSLGTMITFSMTGSGTVSGASTRITRFTSGGGGSDSDPFLSITTSKEDVVVLARIVTEEKTPSFSANEAACPEAPVGLSEAFETLKASAKTVINGTSTRYLTRCSSLEGFLSIMVILIFRWEKLKLLAMSETWGMWLALTREY